MAEIFPSHCLAEQRLQYLQRLPLESARAASVERVLSIYQRWFEFVPAEPLLLARRFGALSQ